MAPWGVLLVSAGLLILGLSLRLLAILPPRRRTAPRRHPNRPAHLMIVLGSGGHTSEMMLGLEGLDPRRFSRRTWIVSSGDSFSAERAREFEERFCSAGQYSVVTVPRARRVHQGLLTTPATALNCLLACMRLISRGSGTATKGKQTSPFPDVIVTNGPGTAVIVVLAAILVRFFDLSGRANDPSVLRTIYFESWARVDRLSLSGKLLQRLVDRFVVQWPQLQKSIGGRAEYRGWLVLDEKAPERS